MLWSQLWVAGGVGLFVMAMVVLVFWLLMYLGD